jgi:hypothetical protein
VCLVNFSIIIFNFRFFFSVKLPSWQAQLKGTKEWLIAPTPECIFECHFFSVIVNPGDISKTLLLT